MSGRTGQISNCRQLPWRLELRTPRSLWSSRLWCFPLRLRSWIPSPIDTQLGYLAKRLTFSVQDSKSASSPSHLNHRPTGNFYPPSLLQLLPARYIRSTQRLAEEKELKIADANIRRSMSARYTFARQVRELRFIFSQTGTESSALR